LGGNEKKQTIQEAASQKYRKKENTAVFLKYWGQQFRPGDLVGKKKGFQLLSPSFEERGKMEKGTGD